MRNTKTLMIPTQRAGQLYALAEHHGLTVVEMIERMIARGMEEAGIPSDLPGLEVVRIEPDLIHFSANWFPIVHFTREEALAMADGLERAVEGVVRVEVEPGPDCIETRRVGRGINLNVCCAETGTTGNRNFTRSIALDLAKQFRKVAE